MNKRRNSHFIVEVIKFIMHQKEPAFPLEEKNTNMSEQERDGREGHRLKEFENRVFGGGFMGIIGRI
jgi:hypothetical protein